MPRKRFYTTLALALGIIFVWSAIRPHDFFTWLLEVFPVIIALPLLWGTHKRFTFTRLAYVLMLVHAIILMVGGHYTYALVPLGNWVRDAFDLTRNHYDRLGHLAQGFIPAIITREILLRTSPLKRGRWLFCLVVCVCLAISAAYELLEWGVAELTGTEAEAFLATQGDVWDTQKDMAFATIGAISALLLLGRKHDRQLERLFRETRKEENTGSLS